MVRCRLEGGSLASGSLVGSRLGSELQGRDDGPVGILGNGQEFAQQLGVGDVDIHRGRESVDQAVDQLVLGVGEQQFVGEAAQIAELHIAECLQGG